jgi:maltodextrin utilization protein YvdJ
VGFDSGQTAVLNIGDTYLGTTDDGENVVAVVYKIKNTGNAKISFLDVVMDVAKQNGKELEVNYSADDIADGSIADKVQDYDDIAPGQEVEVVRAYTLTDTTKTVSLTATGWGSHDSETLAADVTLK